MYEDSFELYKLLKLPIAVQDTIIQKLTEQKDFEVSKDNATKLKNELLVGRMNTFIENAIKESVKKPVKKVAKKKVVKVVEESSDGGSSSREIFDLEL